MKQSELKCDRCDAKMEQFDTIKFDLKVRRLCLLCYSWIDLWLKYPPRRKEQKRL